MVNWIICLQVYIVLVGEGGYGRKKTSSQLPRMPPIGTFKTPRSLIVAAEGRLIANCYDYLFISYILLIKLNLQTNIDIGYHKLRRNNRKRISLNES